MANGDHESEIQRLIKKLREEIAAEEQMARNLPRAREYDNVVICDALENTRLSFGGRGLLAYCLSRESGFTISYSLLDAIGSENRMGGLFRAIRELEDNGLAKRTGPDCWTFYAVPEE